MSPLVERLAELRRYLRHLEQLQPLVGSSQELERNLSLHNDVLFSLLMVAQLVIDISAELAAREGRRFEDYTSAVRSLLDVEGFSPELVSELSRLPGFRNVLIHDYAELDLDLAVRAMDHLDPVKEFVRLVALRLERE